MSIADTCDIAYVFLVDRVERQVEVGTLAAVTMAAAGAKDVKVPNLDEALAAFDAALAAPFEKREVVDEHDAALRRTLGLR